MKKMPVAFCWHRLAKFMNKDMKSDREVSHTKGGKRLLLKSEVGEFSH